MGRTMRKSIRGARLVRVRAFTFLELIVALVIIGVLLALGAPLMGRETARARTANSAKVVAADLRMAFSLAGRQRKPVRLVIDATGREYRLSDRATGTLYRRRVFGNGANDLRIDSLTASVSSLDVFPGGLASSALTLRLANGHFSEQVTMTRAGQVRIIP
jgi:prepilin-type N-terminal cleavage/methylation domain-containing protein